MYSVYFSQGVATSKCREMIDRVKRSKVNLHRVSARQFVPARITARAGECEKSDGKQGNDDSSVVLVYVNARRHLQ